VIGCSTKNETRSVAAAGFAKLILLAGEIVAKIATPSIIGKRAFSLPASD
jgi:hypothetical protein